MFVAEPMFRTSLGNPLFAASDERDGRSYIHVVVFQPWRY